MEGSSHLSNENDPMTPPPSGSAKEVNDAEEAAFSDDEQPLLGKKKSSGSVKSKFRKLMTFCKLD